MKTVMQSMYSTGAQNTAVGATAPLNNAEGEANTAIGFNALVAHITGSDNTAVGFVRN
jgi:hypothetical protein